uniref:Protein hedgehog n=1 Tax=Globodera pallida TaxID=36090 RepID=A0A183C258_GLOPA
MKQFFIIIILFARLSVANCFNNFSIGEIACENIKEKLHFEQLLPLNVSLSSNYKATLRLTDFLHGNVTAKIVEKYLEGTLVVKKWSREKEVAVFNRTIYFEDRYKWNKTNDQRLTHHKTCLALGNTNGSSAALNASANVLDLSPKLINGTGLSGEGVGQLLAVLQGYGGGWNGTMHSDPLLTNGVETLGYTGCTNTFFKDDRELRLQVELEYAADKTPQQPYSPERHNPTLYTIRVITYDVDGNKTKNPPRGVFCHGMPNVTLPVQFPQPFVAHLRTVHSNKSHHSSAVVDDGTIVYDGAAKMAAMFTSNPNEFVAHDFVYGLQYRLDMARHGTCDPVGPIEGNLHDVARNPNGTMYLLSAEELAVWMGKQPLNGSTSPQFYHSGKVHVGDELLDSYVSQFSESSEAQNANQSAVVVVEVLVANSMDENRSNDQRRPSVRSVVHYSKNGRTTVAFASYRTLLNGWQVLAEKFRACVKATTADPDGGYFVRMGNVSLADLNSQVGSEWSRAAVAQAVANASNLEQSSKGELYAFFAIGAPSGAVQAQTIYLQKELPVTEAIQSLNASIALGNFVVRIPLPTGHGQNTELVISGTQFGERSSLEPRPPPPRPSPEFVGFSGSTLSIVAIFCFISGATFVAGAYILHQKRQYIRGMAYQVFE